MNYPSLVGRDCKSWLKKATRGSTRRVRPVHWVMLGVVAAGIGVVMGVAPHSAEATRHGVLQARETVVHNLSLPAPQTTPGETAHTARAPESSGEWRRITIRPGDSLAAIFTRQGLSAGELHQIIALGGVTRKLTRIHPGETLRLRIGPRGRLQTLVHEIDRTHAIQVKRTGEGFEASSVHRAPEHRVAYASGVIRSSLFNAAQDAG
ncbi:MAG TPA: LysM-like peptidoglycan-binding domain-containing protein, partial [Gammaproteobacteria bacterium]|nr:LysM-like peptidoglycan-binding domain-containing protein [Gammaproteobacteria bacterium]